MLVGCKGVARRSRPSSARRCQKKKSREFYQSGLAKTDFIEGGGATELITAEYVAASRDRLVAISVGDGGDEPRGQWQHSWYSFPVLHARRYYGNRRHIRTT